ncbi:hypothetical protein [Desulfatibacillum aliphaticivorans]|uniref:hypothetical protein n=1 Tax=Desulfatibacillum aliphaticivorans TaxID=218208 RepID=UPI0012FC9C48|nr:hypothetical protein [Desulfatibacillum aliphaticivorans]
MIHDLVRKAYEHNGDPVKPEDNAYLIYQHAGEYLNENHRRDLLSSDYGDPSHFEDEAIEAIQGCSWILGEMQKAASTPGYYHPFNVDDFLDDNFLSDFFMLMKFSKMSAVYFAYQGDFNQASLYLRALEQFGERVYEQEGTLIGTLMGVAYLQHERSGAESCLFLAGEQAFPGGKELPADLMLSNEVLSRSLDMELAFVVNQFAQYDESEHSLSALFWDIDWDYPEWLEIIDPVWFIFYTFTANHQLKATITHLHQLQKNFRTPCDQMFNRWEDMLADAPRMFREDSDSNFSLLMYSNCRLQAIHDIKRTAWAVHHYRVDKHTFPTCVGDLTPAYIETIPLDPFTNEPLELEFMAEGLSIHSMGVPDLKSTAMEFHMGAAYEKYRLNPPEEDEEI